MCHPGHIFPSITHLCPFVNKNQVGIHLYILYPVYFKAYEECNLAGELGYL